MFDIQIFVFQKTSNLNILPAEPITNFGSHLHIHIYIYMAPVCEWLNWMIHGLYDKLYGLQLWYLLCIYVQNLMPSTMYETPRQILFCMRCKNLMKKIYRITGIVQNCIRKICSTYQTCGNLTTELKLDISNLLVPDLVCTKCDWNMLGHAKI